MLYWAVVRESQKMSVSPEPAQRERGEREMERRDMVWRQIEGRGVQNRAVLDALMKVERHLFVPEDMQAEAYADYPLPIGEGQTISQPYIVGLMTELLEPEKDNRVLEIGTGSGYQAAILAEIVSEVYTIEIVPKLGESAQAKLKELGIQTILVPPKGKH